MKESLQIGGRERGRKGSTKGTIRQKKKKKKGDNNCSSAVC